MLSVLSEELSLIIMISKSLWLCFNIDSIHFSIKADSFVSGIPADLHNDVLKQYAALRKLPNIIKKIR